MKRIEEDLVPTSSNWKALQYIFGLPPYFAFSKVVATLLSSVNRAEGKRAKEFDGCLFCIGCISFLSEFGLGRFAWGQTERDSDLFCCSIFLIWFVQMWLSTYLKSSFHSQSDPCYTSWESLWLFPDLLFVLFCSPYFTKQKHFLFLSDSISPTLHTKYWLYFIPFLFKNKTLHKQHVMSDSQKRQPNPTSDNKQVASDIHFPLERASFWNHFYSNIFFTQSMTLSALIYPVS